MSLQLVKIYSSRCVFIDKKRHKIYTSPITEEARIILDWNNRNIPAND